MKTQRSYRLQIDMTFGSDYQHDALMPSLRSVVKAWAEVARDRHKRNSVVVKETLVVSDKPTKEKSF